MKYRFLGNTGIKISEIGFGAWGIGGASDGHAAYGVTDDRESIVALQTAFDEGVTFYDTSDLYGMGHSEELIGRVFQGKRNQVIIATKGGMMNSEGEQNFTCSYLLNALNKSLTRLGTEYVDLYQFHSPPITLFDKDANLMEFAENIVRSGKARVVGISARSPQEALIAIERYGFEAVQVNINLLDWRAIDIGLLRRCQELGVGVIARTPLCFGFLTGRYSIEDVRDPNDHRARWSKEQLVSWISASSLFESIIQSGKNQTPGQNALRFCLSFPSVSSVIPGMLTRSQVLENIQASLLGVLTNEEIEQLQKINRDQIFINKANT